MHSIGADALDSLHFMPTLGEVFRQIGSARFIIRCDYNKNSEKSARLHQGVAVARREKRQEGASLERTVISRRALLREPRLSLCGIILVTSPAALIHLEIEAKSPPARCPSLG